ncbi:AfsR/SARP family transcriptional regulator [Actinacidiphila rubida]|uniref:DNA-binding transcriptional activator of the SARP family n=1 Tax=Actinacidiphila rubida TaxID=310780 RepID=A0A1H8EH09_9ACTN|nr:AfsR/SARP family transcriptional regulator [Actinacidiphila rubida]SEN18157.1 DNA-binding transcriptional activator of the SARP family [Actinacidiphila rubida]
MEFAILGPLRVYEQDRIYAPTAPKQRQLLALLLLNANQVVSTSTCIEELWEDNPPNTALSTLQSYILQLRRMLKQVPRIGSLQAARHVLETRGGGYLLSVGTHELDVNVFADLVREGRAALGKDDVHASRVLGQALTMWKGGALSDVTAGPILRTHLAGLEENRTSVQEQRIDADLRLGRHHELLGELSALTTQYPTHENLHAQFMLALYRSGRRIQALGVVQRLREVLHDELGLEPSPAIRHLHQAILACDAAIEAPGERDTLLSLDQAARAGHAGHAGHGKRGAGHPRPVPEVAAFLPRAVDR